METRKRRMSSLKTRMVWSYFLLIVLVVSVLGAIFIAFIWNYYYGSAESSLMQRVNTDMELSDRAYFSAMTKRDKATFMLEETASGPFQIQLLDYDGRFIIDADGFTGDRSLTTPDVKAAINGEIAVWRGNDPSFQGERIMAVTVPLLDGQRITGFLRYSTAIYLVDEMVGRIIRWTLAIGVSVVFLFLTLSIWMARRIVKPIQSLTESARSMADGDWSKRAVTGKDEIGQLGQTFNTLAVELSKREQMKNDFISSISHELRTPLTSIKGWTETLTTPDLAREELTMGLAIIQRETNRLSGLVEDLLDFSHLYARRIELRLEEVDVHELVLESIRQLSIRQDPTGITLISEVGNHPIVVRGDQRRLKQVLINLIDNAFKFTEKGGTITVTARTIEDQAIIAVADTGRGIDPENLPHVTEKFYKGTSGQSGSGLGLAICEELIELHQGTLVVDSQIGVGTKVSLRIPLHREEKNADT
ncbi:HAMP domain-containing sensor histidine kinase [Halalkalibacterium halodurans]|uniref:sensor histidine kinase n=2 Tax=Halalkalibacterium halodurans TaxID=86665 RepID=UPI002E1D6245|nr:HAMP domain-containing sensor histidine kinase [Halalkalibacterium halodurans]MED4147339.1 HAMP domain-containing sensor histidine kinase [Halalkalibacterium halodurans]MED4190626.1 HAMP domain-containing sensor histidine kinase [Halalkalibacterium halodurans]MED4219985.1 HAMP domain-containing sensor histidine kinase [Halalkalibacterium halodurans]